MVGIKSKHTHKYMIGPKCLMIQTSTHASGEWQNPNPKSEEIKLAGKLALKLAYNKRCSVKNGRVSVKH